MAQRSGVDPAALAEGSGYRGPGHRGDVVAREGREPHPPHELALVAPLEEAISLRSGQTARARPSAVPASAGQPTQVLLGVSRRVTGGTGVSATRGGVAPMCAP
jgi:hypothetical protein